MYSFLSTCNDELGSNMTKQCPNSLLVRIVFYENVSDIVLKKVVSDDLILEFFSKENVIVFTG